MKPKVSTSICLEAEFPIGKPWENHGFFMETMDFTEVSEAILQTWTTLKVAFGL